MPGIKLLGCWFTPQFNRGLVAITPYHFKRSACYVRAHSQGQGERTRCVSAHTKKQAVQQGVLSVWQVRGEFYFTFSMNSGKDKVRLPYSESCLLKCHRWAHAALPREPCSRLRCFLLPDVSLSFWKDRCNLILRWGYSCRIYSRNYASLHNTVFLAVRG